MGIIVDERVGGAIRGVDMRVRFLRASISSCISFSSWALAGVVKSLGLILEFEKWMGWVL